MIERFLQLANIIKDKSIFLLGPRLTGKSTLLRHIFPTALSIDLLETDIFRRLSSNPEAIRELIPPQTRVVIIDEIQKLPILLDEVQRLIDRNRDLRFALTGSSARKLKRGAANLLGGRALFCHLHPLVSQELGGDRLLDRMNRGSLPAMVDSLQYDRDLGAYVGGYLREEIQAEGLTRSIGNFGRVLDTAARSHGGQINFTSIGNDAQVPPRTVADYFQLFEDTLIGTMLPTFTETKSRKAMTTPKFYFFDAGVARVVARRGAILPGSSEFGDALEHIVYLELRAYIDYTFSRARLSYWRSQSKFEVDFLVDTTVAIEVKGTANVTNAHLKGLRALAEDVKFTRKIVVSCESMPRLVDDIEVMHYNSFFQKLWSGELF